MDIHHYTPLYTYKHGIFRWVEHHMDSMDSIGYQYEPTMEVDWDAARPIAMDLDGSSMLINTSM